jgi:hypothetical protein
MGHLGKLSLEVGGVEMSCKPTPKRRYIQRVEIMQNYIKIILHQCSRGRQLFRHPDALLLYKVKWYLPFVVIVTCSYLLCRR